MAAPTNYATDVHTTVGSSIIPFYLSVARAWVRTLFHFSVLRLFTPRLLRLMGVASLGNFGEV